MAWDRPAVNMLRGGLLTGEPDRMFAIDVALVHGREPHVRARWITTLRRLVALPTVSASPALERAASLLAQEAVR